MVPQIFKKKNFLLLRFSWACPFLFWRFFFPGLFEPAPTCVFAQLESWVFNHVFCLLKKSNPPEMALLWPGTKTKKQE